MSIYNEISNLQKDLANAPVQVEVSPSIPVTATPKAMKKSAIEQILSLAKQNSQADFKAKGSLLNEKKESAKRNIEKGFYSEASRNIQEALQIEPNDAEAKAIHAKIKTLQ